MKRKLALLLAAVMVAAMVPVSAFAKTTNHVTNSVVVEKNTYLNESTAPVLKVKLDDGLATDVPFELVLDGAEWKLPVSSLSTDKDGDTAYITGAYASDDTAGYIMKVGTKGTYNIAGVDFEATLLDAQTLSFKPIAGITVSGTVPVFEFPMMTKVTGEAATVTLAPGNSKVTAGSYTFATTTSSSATAKIGGMIEVEIDGSEKELKPITLTETVKGAFEANEVIKLKLYGDFKFVVDGITAETNNLVVGDGVHVADDEITFTVSNPSNTAGKISITGIKIQTTKKAKAGDVAEIVISSNKGALDKTTLEVATAISYGVSFTAEDKKLPVFYAGRKYPSDATLEVTFKELAEDSWWAARKTTLTFPEGVKVIDVEFTGDVAATDNTGDVTWENNVVTIKPDAYSGTAKAEWKAKFYLSISPDFVGDITCTVGGPAVKEDIEVVVAEADYAVRFVVEVADVSIDYRNVPVGDIIIKETFAGALKEDTVLGFYLDNIELEGKAKVEVVEGDIEVELEDYSDIYGAIELEVTDESYKAPSTIKITGIEAFLDRSLPAGDYALKVTSYDVVDLDNNTNNGYEQSLSLFENYADKQTVKTATADGWFNVYEYELAEDYIKVVTAGRDQDDSTFTTSVAVTIGANTMTVGKAVVALDVPAYIANGYTMLPVRAVADALSGNGSTILWDGASQTVTIAFGARIISMTIGSKVMNINGVAVAMSAAPEITNGRTFLPVRDLAYALGLTDADINWNDATKTATLN